MPSSSLTLRRAAGELLMVGVEGPQLSRTEAAWLTLIRPGGVILFRRNVESAAQTHALLARAREIIDAPLFRAIDVEGGSVDRLRDLIAPMPSAQAVGAARNSALDAAHGRLIGRELRLLGLNLTLAPVLDLRTAASESVLASRAVSSDPREVAAYAKSFLKGLAEEGVLGCGKHFPGLGSGQVDSHHVTPAIGKPFASLWEEDLLPYRKLAVRLRLVMVSHASYPLASAPPKPVPEPASISRFWITEVLKQRLGYRGLVVSDDMEMGGILSHTGIADAAVRAVLAGTHVVEICHDPALIFAAYEALLAEGEASPAFARLLRKTAAEARAFKRTYLKRDRLPAPPSARAVREARAQVERFAKQVGHAS